MKHSTIQPKAPHPLSADELRRRAEKQLSVRRKNHRLKTGGSKSETDVQRLSSELQVHQIELEMQNAELQQARDRMEAMLEKYTDLYDFSPVGHFSLDEQGQIMEVNLTGAALLGVERARLINRRLALFVLPLSLPIFQSFLERVFAGTGKQVCEVALIKKDAPAFWAGFQGISAISISGPRKWCRVAFSDITSIKQAEEAKHRLEVLTASNRKLEQEIVRRKAMEISLKKSEQHQGRLLEQARQMQEQLRHLSRRILSAQEEERKRISRELHDIIAQTLTGINVRLAALKIEAAAGSRGLSRKISDTQQLVEKSVDIVHQFARELRPSVLDDLGLIPALHSHMKDFARKTGIHVHLKAFDGVESISIARRTVLYRVAGEALTNIDRHAHADHVEVNIQKIPGAILMSISDNGRGFNPEQILHASRYKRLGLLGISERVEMVDGTFTIKSAPGNGTTINAQIPFNNGPRKQRISRKAVRK